MMLVELTTLLDCVGTEGVSKEVYIAAIEEQNCLAKPSGKSRVLTGRHLVALYSLDPNTTLFRSLLYFWERDRNSRPLLALLCSYARDEVLRDSSTLILGTLEDQLITREQMEALFEKRYPGRFSPATLKSVAQNVNGSWTKSGHLRGGTKKYRAKPQVSAGAIAYALLLAYLHGYRGMNLFSSEYVKLLDCGRDRGMELAEEASRRGWIIFKSVGDVVEVLFPKLLTPEEQELVREQA
ncbi:MAG: hypothetical protein JW963_08410 [Anaerolineales bacterium]|nr:hypothetical protein [Anaerolineales bacterium]